MFKRLLINLLLLVFICFNVNAQEVYEKSDNEVVKYLSNLSNKGIINFNDLILPVPKNKIIEGLDNAYLNIDKLNNIEKSELLFYRKEFNTSIKKIKLLPIFSGALDKGSNKNFTISGIGVNTWGTLSKKISFEFSFQDVNLKGTGLDTSTKNISSGSVPGHVFLNDPLKINYQNYTELRAGLTYSFLNGHIFFGQDQLNWGYGENGKLVLSDKAPNYPMIRIDYALYPWLNFNYTHAWLESNMIDSSLSYPIATRVFPSFREVNIQKFMASHSLNFTLKKGVNLAIGESMIYNDHLSVGYLLPVMFFKAYDNLTNRGVIQAGSNGQFFLQLNTKNYLIPKFSFYTTLFIDEIRVSSIFDKLNARNQIGFNIGCKQADFLVPNLNIGMEYTRINPFVYRNFLPAQDYTSNGYLLGEWIGENADKFIGSVSYTPIPKLKLYLRYQKIRKGDSASIHDQYFSKPQPSFLNTIQYTSNELYFKTSYQYINRLNIYLTLTRSSYNYQNAQVGFSYGL